MPLIHFYFGFKTDVGKDTEREAKGATEDEMVIDHHQLNEHEFEQTLGDSEGQGSLACYSSWGRKESDMIQQLNSNNNIQCLVHCLTHNRY